MADGLYAPGERLPRQHDLAKEYEVAFSTLKQALDILEQEGYVVRKVGQGTYASLPDQASPVALVVDDDDDIRQLFTISLESVGWDSVPVGSGGEALEQLGQRAFDVIFLDIAMPDMDGSETFRELRKRDPTANVVIVTGYADSDAMQQALLIGPFAVMRKPFTLEDLELVLETVGGKLFWMTGKGRSPFQRLGERSRGRVFR